MSTTPAPAHCVCAAAAQRVQALYGDLEGQDVWLTRVSRPTTSYRGVLRLPAEWPGHVHLDRGGDSDRRAHVDDVLELITHADHEARSWARYESR